MSTFRMAGAEKKRKTGRPGSVLQLLILALTVAATAFLVSAIILKP